MIEETSHPFLQQLHLQSNSNDHGVPKSAVHEEEPAGLLMYYDCMTEQVNGPEHLIRKTGLSLRRPRPPARKLRNL